MQFSFPTQSPVPPAPQPEPPPPPQPAAREGLIGEGQRVAEGINEPIRVNADSSRDVEDSPSQPEPEPQRLDRSDDSERNTTPATSRSFLGALVIVGLVAGGCVGLIIFLLNRPSFNQSSSTTQPTTRRTSDGSMDTASLNLVLANREYYSALKKESLKEGTVSQPFYAESERDKEDRIHFILLPPGKKASEVKGLYTAKGGKIYTERKVPLPAVRHRASGVTTDTITKDGSVEVRTKEVSYFGDSSVPMFVPKGDSWEFNPSFTPTECKTHTLSPNMKVGPVILFGDASSGYDWFYDAPLLDWKTKKEVGMIKTPIGHGRLWVGPLPYKEAVPIIDDK